MGFRTPRGMTRRARRHFVLEQLERREMLSATAVVRPTANSADVGGLSRPVLAAGAPSVTGPAASGLRNIPMPIAALITSRSFDGTGNNVANPEWGSAGEQLLRVAPAQYGDAISTPGGEDRPSPREISNVIVAQDEEPLTNDRQLSAFIYVWGQFIDHDIALTEPPGSDYEAYSIAVPPGDAMFDPDGTGAQVIRFNRSRYNETTGIDVDNPREQINQVTAWIDGSMVYGSDETTADSLRTFPAAI